jgi:glucokinase
MAIIGLDIGGTKILGALFNERGQIIKTEKKSSKAEEGFDVFIKQVRKVIKKLMKESLDPIKGIGIGFPGIVDDNGFVLFSPNLPIEKFDLKGHLTKKFKVPVVIGNDVNMGTFGEYKEMKMDCKNVIGLFPGTGLGGGIIINKKLYIGQGFAGELGHIVVQKDGVLCNCGNHGCLESYASKKGIMSFLKQEIDKGRTSVLQENIESNILKSSALFKAVKNKDELALEAMKQFEEYLGMGIGIIMNIFNPDVIVIGGGIIETFGDTLLEEVKIYAKKNALPGMYKNSKIISSKLKDNAVIYGGYHAILDYLE